MIYFGTCEPRSSPSAEWLRNWWCWLAELYSCGSWRRVVWAVLANISEEPPPSIFRVEIYIYSEDRDSGLKGSYVHAQLSTLRITPFRPVVWIGETRNAYRILMGEYFGGQYFCSPRMGGWKARMKLRVVLLAHCVLFCWQAHWLNGVQSSLFQSKILQQQFDLFCVQFLSPLSEMNQMKLTTLVPWPCSMWLES